MSEWFSVAIQDISSRITSGGTPSTKMSSYYGGNIPWLNTKEINFNRITKTESFISELGFNNSSAKWIEPNSVIVAMYGATAGKVSINNIALTTNQACCNITINQEKADYRFVYYSLSCAYVELLNLACGAAQQNLNVGLISSFLINIPEISEQKAIASILSSLDDKIDLLHRQNKTLEAMAETLFRQWFVEEAQESWKDGILGDFADNIKDAIKAHEIQPEGIYVGLEHIDRRNIALNQSGLGEEVNSNKYAFARGDILFGKLRPYFHKVCFAPFSGICSTDILVIRPKKPEWFAFCLFAFFQNDVVEYANLGSGGTRMPRTDWGALKMYPIAMPDPDTLKQFNNIVLPSLDKITYNLSQIRTLEKLRDTLLPKLMSGEVRVAV